MVEFAPFPTKRRNHEEPGQGRDAPCEDILTQLNAANGALHRLSFIILDAHLRHCVREGIESGNADETIESFAEALENFSKMA